VGAVGVRGGAVLLRMAIGVGGGYLAASLLAIMLALVVEDRREGVLWGTLAGYPAYVAAIIASFAVADVRRLGQAFAAVTVLLAIIAALAAALRAGSFA
jgi:hypothetical protein